MAHVVVTQFGIRIYIRIPWRRAPRRRSRTMRLRQSLRPESDSSVGCFSCYNVSFGGSSLRTDATIGLTPSLLNSCCGAAMVDKWRIPDNTARIAVFLLTNPHDLINF